MSYLYVPSCSDITIFIPTPPPTPHLLMCCKKALLLCFVCLWVWLNDQCARSVSLVNYSSNTASQCCYLPLKWEWWCMDFAGSVAITCWWWRWFWCVLNALQFMCSSLVWSIKDWQIRLNENFTDFTYCKFHDCCSTFELLFIGICLYFMECMKPELHISFHFMKNWSPGYTLTGNLQYFIT